ncbi:MAG: hypothetical protein UY21_C0005G0006 [Microgenomates group bacterium GW2011_GWA1_48_10]|uniref:Plasmid stabilization protein n=1 Tax=Candidatus Gottesmanbacteria bacterium RIFCSPHIGHO2_01_FULL_47_48 TaxID=1798381 RepID=A0A1F6A575_9BACT|nr:MAG: hypothetical protein UY21_C0005G0006 [Microgenomates group bacterium GW2011_GWA1_48_10]OGG19783.1 MAG: hypothetical protein A2721_01265 [Candidatus Gottesmanbacteria bacterium RIFCSPHIGHO2_01_FULL_47_48]
MIIKYSPFFLKKLKQVDVRIRKSFKEKIGLFLKDHLDPRLNNHVLRNDFAGLRSIDVTADWRAVYEERSYGEDRVAYFVNIGTHRELYR